MALDHSKFTLLKKKGDKSRAWLRLRGNACGKSFWIGRAYFSTGAPVLDYEGEIDMTLNVLASIADLAFAGGDVDVPFAWTRDGPSTVSAGNSGKIKAFKTKML